MNLFSQYLNIKKMHMMLAFLLIFSIFQESQPELCFPTFPRMHWNPNSPQITSTDIDLIFMFNTYTSCPYSYMHLFYEQQIYKFRCTQKIMQTYDNQTGQVQFQMWVHRCPAFVREDHQIGSFRYILFGSKYINSPSATPTPTYEVDLPKASLPLKFAVFADWGPIFTKPYTPLNTTLEYLISQRQKQRQASPQSSKWRINGLLFNGDLAYNLQTDKCRYYIMLMQDLTKVSRFWPMVVGPGNHQRGNVVKSMYLYQSSFQIGGLSFQNGNYSRTQVYRFMNRTSIIFFDPWFQIYNLTSPQKYSQMKTALLKALHHRRQSYPQQFVTVFSHYPVTCSQIEDPHCRDARLNMPDLYEQLSQQIDGKGLVDFYIGAHMHQYERVWPYTNNKFVNISQPYPRGKMVNLVQGVAGVQYGIIDHPFQTQQWSVYTTYNKTGLGILTINETSKEVASGKYKLGYQHFTTEDILKKVDQFVIDGVYENAGNVRSQDN